MSANTNTNTKMNEKLNANLTSNTKGFNSDFKSNPDFIWVEFVTSKGADSQSGMPLADRIIYQISSRQIQVMGCQQMMEETTNYLKKFGTDFLSWPYPFSSNKNGVNHVELLWTEFLLKAAKTLDPKTQLVWNPPCTSDEVCHCRKVSLAKIEESIFRGSTTVEMIKEKTQASSACGTCRPEVENILQYRLAQIKK